MLCQRCGGLMVIANACDRLEEELRTEFKTTRCINCGNFEDAVVRSNRSASHGPRDIESQAVGTSKPHAVQTHSLGRALPREGAFTERSRSRAPRLPVAPYSINRRADEGAHSAQVSPPIQTSRRCT
jgi:hypothetical protein